MKTLNYLGLITLTALTLSSCSNDEIVPNTNPQNAIEFGTYLGRDAQTRGTTLTTSNLTKFGVFAYYTGTAAYTTASFTPNFMYDQLVEKSSDKWNYTPVKYWPNNANDKVSFFAYAPHQETNVAVATSPEQADDPKINYTVDPATENQIDLLWAKEVDRVKQPVDNKVQFTFQHALSRIAFSVESIIDKVNEDGTNTPDDGTNGTSYVDGTTTVKVKQVRLIGNFANAGTLNLNGGEWVNASKSATTYTLNSGNFVAAVADAVGTSKAQLNNEDSYLMILPQTTTCKIEVTYDVITTDAALSGGNSTITNVITSDAFDFEFVKGNAYNFCLHLGLTSVKFDATVSDWNEIGGIAVNVPLN